MTIRDELMDIINNAICAHVPLTGTPHLFTDMHMDSLSFVHLVLDIEERFAITFDLIEIEKCLHIDTLIALVESKAKEARHDSPSINEPP